MSQRQLLEVVGNCIRPLRGDSRLRFPFDRNPGKKNKKKPAAVPKLTIRGSGAGGGPGGWEERGEGSEAAERHDASPQSPDGPDLGTP